MRVSKRREEISPASLGGGEKPKEEKRERKEKKKEGRRERKIRQLFPLISGIPTIGVRRPES